MSIVGVDLGTTNSLVAHINREGRPEIIINERGSRLTPSVIYFKNDQEVLVGEIARSQALLQAERTVTHIKRQMGTNYQVSINQRGYSPVELSALILRKLRQYAEKHLENPLEGAVVTVPAYFNDNQRQATFMAGELAGVKILKLLNEPTAAALAYAAELDKNEHILVLDIGGGTFDITLMDYENGMCRVRSTGGSSSLGGIDFDQRLEHYIVDTFQQQTSIDLSGDPVAMQQILINAEKAKIDLSTVNECTVLIPYLSMSSSGPVHLNQLMQRQEFNHLCNDLLAEIESLIQRTFERADLTQDWVDVVVFAGGASRMPGFHDCVQALFPGVQIKDHINPDEVVALGAALQAGMLSGQILDVELHDVTSHTLGLEDDQGQFVPIIQANTPYPVGDSQLFTTVEDNQPEVIVHIMQRDEMAEGDKAGCISLGRFHLAGIAPAAGGDPNIDVSFEIDRNGILRVSAVDIDSGVMNEIHISEMGFTPGDKFHARRGRNLKIL
ncbi:MAG TPA: Hsp70 family protein [Syntrophomonadaceae bacterium]|nr:Hsp70 family protein [Syntrophomonadaceae bacterium]